MFQQMSNINMKHFFLFVIFGMVLSNCSAKKNKDLGNKSIHVEEVNLFEQITLSDRISIQLTEGQLSSSLEKKYKLYALNVLKQVSRSQPIFHFSFDDNSINVKELISELNKDESIIEAKTIIYTSKKKK